MSLVYADIFHYIKRNRIFHIKRREVQHIADALLRNILKQKLGCFAVWVNKSDTLAILNILNGHIFQKRGFPHSGFADDIHMTRAILSFYTKRNFPITSICFSEICYFIIIHCFEKKLILNVLYHIYAKNTTAMIISKERLEY